jgi:hypothetical protein
MSSNNNGYSMSSLYSNPTYLQYVANITTSGQSFTAGKISSSGKVSTYTTNDYNSAAGLPRSTSNLSDSYSSSNK